MIEMCDLHGQYSDIKDEIDRAISEVLSSCRFIRGESVAAFEQELAKYLGVRNVIGVGNGTDALQIALMSLGLHPGDEVITPTFTFIATAEVVALLRLKPVVVDVDYDTMTVTAEAIERAITPRTRAIVPVHLFGQNADMEGILDVARCHGIPVIEDACQSLGSSYTFSNGNTRKSGTMGTIGCTSFFPSKNLGCYGDGGALFTDDDTLAARIRMIANHGMSIRYHHDMVGVNSRLDTIQASVLRVKLPHLDEYVAARQRAAQAYCKALKGNSNILLPTVNPKSTHSFHQFTLRCTGISRDALKADLAQAGIPSMIYYPIPLHRQKAYLTEGEFPNADLLASQVLSIPMHTSLTSSVINTITLAINGTTSFSL